MSNEVNHVVSNEVNHVVSNKVNHVVGSEMYRIFTERSDGIIFSVYLTPGASKTCIAGLRYDDANLVSIKISVHGKPVENKANTDLIKLITEEFGLPKSRIEIISGQKSRHKKILLSKYNISNIPVELQEQLSQEICKMPKTLF